MKASEIKDDKYYYITETGACVQGYVLRSSVDGGLCFYENAREATQEEIEACALEFRAQACLEHYTKSIKFGVSEFDNCVFMRVCDDENYQGPVRMDKQELGLFIKHLQRMTDQL